MVSYEFYLFEDELWCKSSKGDNILVGEEDTELVAFILDNVRAKYTEAYKALEKWYQKSSANSRYYQYLMARRFCKCNFGTLDTSTIDAENADFDVFHFEKVSCPMRGECSFEGIVCQPKFSTCLSSSERRVMKLYFDGFDKEAIGAQLFISPGTVKNHIKNAYMKLGVHSKSEFMKYANDNNMFNQ